MDNLQFAVYAKQIIKKSPVSQVWVAHNMETSQYYLSQVLNGHRRMGIVFRHKLELEIQNILKMFGDDLAQL